MGCDIHVYIEYKEKSDENWRSFGGRINPGRNYKLFELMAGVRSDECSLFSPRGIPDQTGYYAKHDNTLFITECGDNDGEYVKMEKATQWVDSGYSTFINNREGKPTWVTNPDWHTHSWLNLEEYRQVLEVYKKWSIVNLEERKKESENLYNHLVDTKVITSDNAEQCKWIQEVKIYDEPEYQAIEGAMAKFSDMGYDVRIVFWFDN
jgi:hypothetical protein